MISEAITALVGTASLAAFGWVFQKSYTLGTRVTIIETKQEDLPALINAKFDSLGYKFDSMDHRLDRIERAMNGHFNEPKET